MTEPADVIADALQAYIKGHNLPPDTTFVLHSPNCKVPSAELSSVAKSHGSVAVMLSLIPTDELWFTDAGLNHTRVTKIT
jgi:hypothetical protein